MLNWSTAFHNNKANRNTQLKIDIAVERMKEKEQSVSPKVGAEAELPFFEKFVYFLVYSYFLAMAMYKIYLYPLGRSTCYFE